VKYVPRLPPRKHQTRALELARAPKPIATDAFAYLMEMGTGKSKVVCDEFGERVYAKDLRDLLIIAPAGCYRNWTEDASPEELGEFHKHLAPELWEKLVWCRWTSGMNSQRKNELRYMLSCTDRPRAFVVNVEAMSTVKKAREAVREFLMPKRALFAIDESTKIKGHSSARSEECVSLGELAPARRILSGLVSPQSPLDVYAQYNFLDWRILGQRNFYAFRAKYAITREMRVGGRPDSSGKMQRGRNVRVIVGYRNLDELQEKIAPYSYRVLAKDCQDLPEQIYAPIRHVELTDEQRRIYHELLDYATAELASKTWVTADIVLTQRLRLDQLLCGHIVDEEKVLREVPEKRTDELMEVLGECEGKAVIWTSHDYSVRKITARLKQEYGPRSVAQFWGGTRSTRGADEARFKTDAECRWMVSTPASGGMGNNWTVANLCVFYNNSDSLEHRLQGEKRPHREGQRFPVTYVDLCVPKSIDYKKIKALRAKLDIATLINGDNYREWLI
jgi:hypothetical protein